MNYSDSQIKFIMQMREETDLTWDEITYEYNARFNENKTKNAIRKTHKRVSELGHSLHAEDVDSEDVLVKNLKTTFTARKAASKLRKENKVLIDEQLTSKEFLEQLSNQISDIDFKVHKKVKKKKSKTTNRVIVGHISDTHIGVNIRSSEMGGINNFNNKIAARRFAYFFRELADYKIEHRKDTELVLVLNGDIFAGIIHGQEAGVDLMATQFSAGIKIFTEGISYVSQFYKKVTVHCTTGNHDRFMHKENKGRQTEQKWDSFTTNLYVSLRQIFAYDKDIDIVVPETPYSLFKVFGHTFLATHGDTFVNLGNPGKSINTKSITDQINNLSTGLGVKVDVLMGGHVHKATYQTLDNGTELVINGTLSGTDQYAQSLGIVGNNPAQQIFEVTKDHAVGDVRFVRLLQAGKDKDLDDIIEPLEGLF